MKSRVFIALKKMFLGSGIKIYTTQNIFLRACFPKDLEVFKFWSRRPLAYSALGSIFLFLGVLGGGIRAETSEGSTAQMIKIIQVLNDVPAGRRLLQQALKRWQAGGTPEYDQNVILDKVKWGTTSRTDTTLTRHFNPKTGKEDRERELIIYLKKDLTETELVLDLAHELVHAVSRPYFDPYDPTLTPGKYIAAAIEGEGGEVDAVVTECQVGLELMELHGLKISRCQNYILQQGTEVARIDREKVLLDFYKVGQWHEELSKLLGKEISIFPLLSSQQPQLYSSTGRAPYPIALAKEFETINEMACDNSRKRMKSVSTSISSRLTSVFSFSRRSSQFSATRSPAAQFDVARQDVWNFIQKRCR